MNIREAANQLEQAARAYSARTPEGEWRVPLAAQRPVYLIGPPGVGKTAAVAQVAGRLGVGYAAYTMTHHTRQSALGLPMIVRKTLNGEERSVTEYTVSEIVAGVWEKAEAGAETGILFLDEINCVSESLMPAVLQLLQYKTFGVHALPRGWMIVCAGNPPRYNRYAHTFDAVVMDRLRVIEVEPDYEAWREYAVRRGAHPAVRSYLALRTGDFYVPDGDRIVTARSWTDLSDMMLALEAGGEAISPSLFGQYLQVEEVAERFSLYFRLCADTGARLDEAVADRDGGRLAGLPFDEALFAALMLAGRLEARAEEAAALRREGEKLTYFAEGVSREKARTGRPVDALCREQLERLELAREARVKAGLSDAAAERRWLGRLRALGQEVRGLEGDRALALLRGRAGEAMAAAEAAEDALASSFEDCLDFAGAAFPDPNVRLVLAADLDSHEAAGRFAARRLRQRWEAFREACDPRARAEKLAGEGR